MRYYSLRSVAEIDAIEQADQVSGSRPTAQRLLARELTQLVHGKAALASAERISDALFRGSFCQLSLAEFEQLELDGIPLTRSENSPPPLLSQLLVQSRLAGSRRQARELINNGAITVNGEPVTTDTTALALLQHRYLVLRRGKKHFHLIRFGN